jgi:hypothetical protein
MHRTTPRFWRCYEALPEEVRQVADRNFALLRADSSHPSLHFKKVGKYWSVRVGAGHRALGAEIDTGILWFWIGTHGEYERLIGNG